MLPADLLGDIFLSIIVEIFSTTHLKRHQNSASATATVVRLSSVNTQWRSIVLSTSRIWSYMTIKYSKRAVQPWEPHPALIMLSLERARNVTLSLRIEAPYTLAFELPPTWDTLAERIMAVVGFLEVTSAVYPGYKFQLAAESALSRLLLKPSPRLSHLKYSLEHPVSRKSHSGSITITDWQDVRSKILPHAPLLVELELKSFGGLHLDMLRPETMHGLRRFRSEIFESKLRITDILAAAPRLQHLELGYSEAGYPSIRSSTFRVAHDLVSLRCESSVLAQLDHTRAPNLRTIHFASEDEEYSALDLSNFFESSPYLALEHLILPTVDLHEPGQLIATISLFKYMPNIQTLGLPSFPAEYGLLTEWAHPENVALLPRLRKITFNKMALFSLDKIPLIEQLEEAAVFQFFEGRRAAIPEACDGANRLALTVELNVRRRAPAIEELCQLMGPYVSTIRVLGSAQHHQPGSHLLEVRDGFQLPSSPWDSEGRR